MFEREKEREREKLNGIVLSHFLTVCSYSTYIRDIGPKESPYRLADKKDPLKETSNEKRMTYHYLVTGGLFNLHSNFGFEQQLLIIVGKQFYIILQHFMLVDYCQPNIPFEHFANIWVLLVMRLLWAQLKLNWIIFRKESL